MSVNEGGVFRIPVWDQERLQIAFKQYSLPTWNTDGEADPMTMHDVELGYLAQIFLATCLPANPPSFIERLGVTGDGEIHADELAFTGQLGVANIDIVFIPDDIDMIFGRSPIYYLGMAGYGFVPQGVIIEQTDQTRFVIGLNLDSSRLLPPQFINHSRSAFVPPQPACDVFYWRLKPGVVANVSVAGMQDTGGVQSGGGVNTSRFNPMLGGFDPNDISVQT